MSLKNRARVRAEAIEEARQHAEQEIEAQQYVRKWKRRTMWLGVAFALCVGGIAPFFDSEPLPQPARSGLDLLVVLAMCFGVAFVWAAAMTYVFWKYLRDIRKIHKEFTPPFMKYRTGKPHEDSPH